MGNSEKGIAMEGCTFFGHRECPDSVGPRLRAVLEALIVERGVDIFYVGHQGQFDALVRRTLQALCQIYPQIHYAVVLAYLSRPGGEPQDYADTLFPEGIETVPRRYAISWRNRWMLGRADYVVTYGPTAGAGRPGLPNWPDGRRRRSLICPDKYILQKLNAHNQMC